MEDALNPENLEAFAKLAFESAKTGNAWMLVSLSLIGSVALVRKFLGPKIPFLQTQAGGAILNLVMAMGGATATALMSGQPMSPELALTAFKVAFSAAGGFTLVKHLLTLFKGRDPVQIKADAAAEGVKAGEAANANGEILSVRDVIEGKKQ